MDRLEAVQQIVDSSDCLLTIQNLRDGWPTHASLIADGAPIPVALYVGVFGKSHRARDSSERRFQNPGGNRPIEHSANRLPLLVGLVEDHEKSCLLVGFDAQRRVGKRTRYSLFAPMGLIEAGSRQGWTVATTVTDEVLVAFHAPELQRYLSFRYRDHREEEPTEPDMANTTEQLEDLSSLLGTESIGLGERIASELGSAPASDAKGVWALLAALAGREHLIDDVDSLEWEAAVRTIAILDDRIAIMLALWEELSPSTPIPHSHHEFVSRIYEHPQFMAREAPDDLQTAVFEIAKRCESELETDDLEVFYGQEGAPTLFFYQSVASHLEASSEPASEAEGADEDDAQDTEDEDSDEHTQPVKASVDKLQVIQLFNLVSKGRLDIEPPWQRKDVWSLKRKRELIKSLILGIPLPSIILHKKDGRMSIIDGKQRLTAIMQFLENEWKLPTYPATPGSPLHECRGAFYAKDGKKSLTDDIRDTLELRNIPALIFEDVPESRLRKIFELYNVAGMKLNAAEIRNAVYQSNPIHKTIYVLAGEGDGRWDLGLGDTAAQKAFANRLRAIYPGSKNRYQGVDFLARYLGYSRAVQRPGTDQFRVPSTSAAINNFFDYRSQKERPEAVARELVSVMDAAERFFDLDSERLAFFVRSDKGQRQFNKLVATTHMVASRFLQALIDVGSVSEPDARTAAAGVAGPPPEKQQRATIWDYQARVLIGLRDRLGVDVGEALGEEWREFFEKMEYCILPAEDES